LELELFDSFCKEELVTDNGGPLVLEDWQKGVLLDHFDTAQEMLCLLPKSNGKTTLFSALSLWHLITVPDATCYIAAASRDQATLMYKHAAGFVKRNPVLESMIDVKGGYRELRRVGGTGFVKTVASDADTLDGIGPTLFLCDELHRHKTPDLYTVGRDGLGKRAGKMVTISTAGANLDSPLGKMRDQAQLLEDRVVNDFHVRAASSDGKFVAHEWSVPEGDWDTDDVHVVKRANPSSFVTVEDLKRRRESPSTHERDWLRFACNRWVGHLEDAWLPVGKWALLGDSEMIIPEHHPIYIGVDIGIRSDHSAVVIVGQRPEDGRWMVESTVFEPPHGDEVDLAMVEAFIIGLHDRYSVQGVVYDRWNFARSAQELSSRGANCIEVPQNNERMVLACSRLLEAINRGEIVHNGDPVLQSHVESAAARVTERGVRVSKGKSGQVGTGKIDALIALLIAFMVATNENPEVSVEWL